MEALMPRLFGALAALCLLTACPPIDPVWVTTDAIPAPVPADPSDSESSTGATPTTSGGTDGVAPDESTSSAVPTSSHADDSTGTGSTSSGDLPQPDACAPTDEFCDTFAAACPTYYDAQMCAKVTPPCVVWPNVCNMCAAAKVTCEQTWGFGDFLCVLGEQKCLASSLLVGCECQPAVFVCATEASECGEGYTFENGTCRPPCEMQEECGLPEYATCEAGSCVPEVAPQCSLLD